MGRDRELVPAALDILRSSRRLRELVGRRWPAVICDEFQDTSDDQWELLTLLDERARLVLLADSHQMIYTFVRGVGPDRLRWAREAAGEAVIEHITVILPPDPHPLVAPLAAFER